MDYSKFLNEKGLEGKRIGVLRSSFNHHPKLDAVFNRSLKVLQEQGAILVDDLKFPTPKDSGKNEYEVLLYEFKHYLNTYLKNTPDKVKVKSLADLIEFNRSNKTAEMPYFNQEIFLSAEEKGPLTDQNYLTALQDSHEIMKVTINKFMEDHNLDLIVSPTTNPATSMDIISGDHFTGSSYSKAAISGYPSITVPMGFIHELPVGLTFVTKAYGEDILIEAAYAYEQKSRERKAPEFKKSQID